MLVLSEDRIESEAERRGNTDPLHDLQRHKGRVPIHMLRQLHFPTTTDVNRHDVHYLPARSSYFFINQKRKQVEPDSTVATLCLRLPQRVVNLQRKATQPQR